MTSSTLRAAAAPSGPSVRLSLVLLACCLGQFMNVLDASVVNVALPSIAADLGFERHQLQWVNNAYTITVCGFLLLGGRLADVLGQRRVFLAGVALFTLASAVGGAAGSPVTLVLARAFQGLGAAVMAPATLTVLGTAFTEAGPRARAFGLWSAVSGAAGAVGVLAGGIITESLSWRWILLVNVPVGLFLLALVRAAVPHSPGVRAPLDVRGAFTVTAGLLALAYGVATAAEHGWNSARVLGPVGAGVLLLALFGRLQITTARAGKQPLVPPEIFRVRTVAAANLVAFFGIAALFSTFYFFTLSLQQLLGYSPLQTGLAYLPLSAGLALGGWGISSVVPRVGARPVLLTGLSLSCAGLLWLARLNTESTYLADVLGPCLLLGFGMGTVLNATTSTATSGIPPHQAGLASGLLNTTRQLGSALGLVTLATLASARVEAALGDGPASGPRLRTALTEGYGLALTGAALFSAAGVLAALTVPARVRGARSRDAQGPRENLTA
ncbi:MFS transporter [Streptomyces sp. NPDC051561]|uniref:MFS transporter n=1 Tax=Streptomyces sp. NPDC051561 TaxID=3365658 RepID=UPI003792D1DE